MSTKEARENVRSTGIVLSYMSISTHLMNPARDWGKAVTSFCMNISDVM